MSVKNCLISVFNKDNLDVLVPYLEENNYNIYTTGGTYAVIQGLIKDKNRVISISDYTTFPEICSGRVKTLHPKIYGGILGLRDVQSHLDDLHRNDCILFDMVVVNLYPFEKVLEDKEKTNICEETLLENIDIGGHTLLRAAVKNYKYIQVLSDPRQYVDIQTLSITSNYELAKRAISSVMKYDIAINNWLQGLHNSENDTRSSDQTCIGISYNKFRDMKYGLNPYMKPSSVYIKNGDKAPFKVLNGNPGYINLLDVQYAIRLVLEVKRQLNRECCASFKHNSPAGVTTGINSLECVKSARNVDAKSSFGDIIGFSGTVTKEIAEHLKKVVSDGIVAHRFTEEALQILKTKKNGNYLVIEQQAVNKGIEFRDINGITLMQPTNNSVLSRSKLESVSHEIQNSMILGYHTLKYTQSNCVCFVYEDTVIGIGSGQQNRVDCVRIAGNKAKLWFDKQGLDIKQVNNIVLVSDAFFPFADNIDVAAEYNTQYILQPGGSIRDYDIISACEKYNMKIVMSNQRVFTH